MKILKRKHILLFFVVFLMSIRVALADDLVIFNIDTSQVIHYIGEWVGRFWDLIGSIAGSVGYHGSERWVGFIRFMLMIGIGFGSWIGLHHAMPEQLRQSNATRVFPVLMALFAFIIPTDWITGGIGTWIYFWLIAIIFLVPTFLYFRWVWMIPFPENDNFVGNALTTALKFALIILFLAVIGSGLQGIVGVNIS